MALRAEPRSGNYLLPFLVVVPVLVGLALGVYFFWADAAAKRDQALRDRVIWDARDIAALIQPTIDHTRQLAHLLEQAHASGSKRDIVKGLAVPTLDLRREFLGVGVVFEPNAFDGRDADYAGRYPENDGRGRFAAYYYREPGKPASTALLEMAELGNTQAWYEVPLKTGQTALLLPYPYKIGGIDVSLSSVAVPMQARGQSIGVTLIDFQMTDIADKVRALNSEEITGAWIISASGSWVVHPDKDKVGTPLALNATGAEGEIEALRRHGGGARTGTPQTRDASNNSSYFMTPIPLDGVDYSWQLVVSVQQPGIWEGVPKDAAKVASVLGVVALLGSLALVQWWMTGRGGDTFTLTQVVVPGAKVGRAPLHNSKAKRSLVESRREPTVRRR